MYNRLVIIGAGGHGRVIADIADKIGYKDIAFLDDNIIDSFMGFPIIGKSNEIEKIADGETDFVIGIGNNLTRKIIAQRYDVNWVSLIHPSAQIGLNVSIGAGTVVMACAVVNSCATVGIHCILNTGAIIEHDNIIDDYVHISPRVALGGTVRIGSCTHVGLGASVKNNVEICENCTIGVGAVVVKNIKEPSTYIGLPVKKL